MSPFSIKKFDLLFNKDKDWRQTTGLANKMKSMDRHALFEEYKVLKNCAPRRNSYFIETHNGETPRADSNRCEERLAIALWNKGMVWWPRPGDGGFKILDYQFPLKARQNDEGIGEIDLLGVTNLGRLTVIELKVKRRIPRKDSPLSALIQGLRYAAIVEANQTRITEEAKKRFDVEIMKKPPIIQVLAPRAWWRDWCELGRSTRKAAGDWEIEFARLADDIEDRLEIVIECIAFDDLNPGDIHTGCGGIRPEIYRDIRLCSVFPDRGRGCRPRLLRPYTPGTASQA